MSIDHTCDDSRHHSVDICLCQSCFDQKIEEAKDSGYKEGYDAGKAWSEASN